MKHFGKIIMDINKISKLHKELATSLDKEEMSPKQLLAWASSLLTQYRQSKSIIRKLTAEDSASEIEHWELIKNFTYTEIDNVLDALYQRSIIEAESFDMDIAIKFVDLTAKIRSVCWEQMAIDRRAAPEEEEINLIID